MTQNKKMEKVKSSKLLYRRGIIFLISLIGVGLLYYFTSNTKKPVVPKLPKISLPGKEISTDFSFLDFSL